MKIIFTGFVLFSGRQYFGTVAFYDVGVFRHV